MEIDGCSGNLSKLHGSSIECYKDHRIAMSFAVLGCIVPGIMITDKECVDKTYPDFWHHLEHRFNVKLYLPSQEENKQAQQNVAENRNVDEVTEDNRSIVVIGMRGSGKSLMGKALARDLGWAYIDLDVEFEKFTGQSIKQFVEVNGWPAFRAKEEELFRSVLVSNAKRTVISTGGGIVETPSAFALLSELINKEDLVVVQVRRNIEDVINYLDADKTRANLGEESKAIWNRRKDLYYAGSKYEFCVGKGEDDWEQSERLLHQFVTKIQQNGKRTVRKILNISPDVPINSAKTYFLSLTNKNFKEVIPFIGELASDVDVIEMRIDLLEEQSEDFVREQITLLRKHTSKPLLFTLRTLGQGGKFDEKGREEQVLILYRLALRMAVDFIDIEITLPQELKKQILQFKNRLGNVTKVISSYHQFNKRIQSEEEIIETMRKCYYENESSGIDVVKVVYFAFESEDVFLLRNAVKRAVEEGKFPADIPLIALAAGEKGKLSRVLNKFLTPVTHPLLPAAAAPGNSFLSVHVFSRTMPILTFFFLFVPHC